MPGTIKVIRHKLAKTDLVQMGLDLELLKMLKGMEIPIGRSKGDSWSDQRGKFIVRRPKGERDRELLEVLKAPKAESEETT